MEQISNIEKRLWGSADTLRANSNFSSNEYFMPVMGLIFLRHAYSRFLKVRDEIIPTLPSRGGVVRDLTKEDFSRRGSIYLRQEAQFDILVSLPEGQSAATALIAAMTALQESRHGAWVPVVSDEDGPFWQFAWLSVSHGSSEQHRSSSCSWQAVRALPWRALRARSRNRIPCSSPAAA